MYFSVLQHLYTAATHLVAPPYCSYCKVWLKERSILCQACLAKITPIVSMHLSVTATYSVMVHALSAYQEPLKTLIKAKHYGDRIASRELAELMWQHSYVSTVPCDVFVPIPLHWTRYAWRGFNQAEEIAHVLARHKHVQVAPILRRLRRTDFQASLSKEYRTSNIKDAFSLVDADASRYEGKHIIIVDDLCTTGATLREAVRCLRTLKPASIACLVAARVG